METVRYFLAEIFLVRKILHQPDKYPENQQKHIHQEYNQKQSHFCVAQKSRGSLVFAINRRNWR